MKDELLKARVKDHWESEVCGSRYGDRSEDPTAMFAEIDAARYEQDYMLKDFARFDEAAGKRVLEVGLGTGSDFANWIRAGAIAHGRDLTEASVEIVRERLTLEGLEADVDVGDAEALDFPDDFFDLYYSWGVLHHTPDTEAAVAEAARVLKPGGEFKVMLYHYPSVGAALVWLVYGPGRGNFLSPRAVYGRYVESPGTKAFTVREATELVARRFQPSSIRVRTYLGSGDLLTQRFSSRYSGRAWKVARAVYPRWFVRRVIGHRLGTVMTIRAVK